MMFLPWCCLGILSKLADSQKNVGFNLYGVRGSARSFALLFGLYLCMSWQYEWQKYNDNNITVTEQNANFDKSWGEIIDDRTAVQPCLMMQANHHIMSEQKPIKEKN